MRESFLTIPNAFAFLALSCNFVARSRFFCRHFLSGCFLWCLGHRFLRKAFALNIIHHSDFTLQSYAASDYSARFTLTAFFPFGESSTSNVTASPSFSSSKVTPTRSCCEKQILLRIRHGNKPKAFVRLLFNYSVHNGITILKYTRIVTENSTIFPNISQVSYKYS